jgi:hypothetical protein
MTQVSMSRDETVTGSAGQFPELELLPVGMHL